MKTPKKIENPNELLLTEIQALSAQYPTFQLPGYSNSLIKIAQSYHEKHFNSKDNFNEEIIACANSGLAAARSDGIKERDICLELSSCGNFEKQLELLRNWSGLNTKKTSAYLQDIKEQRDHMKNLAKNTVLCYIPKLEEES